MKETLIQMIQFMAAVIGPTAEIVLHDIESQKIYAYGNLSVTKRHYSEQDDNDPIRLLKECASKSPGGFFTNAVLDPDTGIRSAECFFKDEAGNLKYVICFNQSVAAIRQITDYFSFFLNGPSVSVEMESNLSEETIDTFTTDLIFDELRRMKYAAVDVNTKEAKLNVLRRLDEKGIFDVKNSTAKVCSLLEISQATLYNYLREIRERS